MEDFQIDCCIIPKTFGCIKSAQLHHFTDASESGYCVGTYLRMMNSDNAFMTGKVRVVPLKQVTILRLALTAAVLAVRTEKMISTELQLPLYKSVFWSDSKTVLKYIRNETQRFHTFVANRISFIREAADVSQWRYVNTKHNPADHGGLFWFIIKCFLEV